MKKYKELLRNDMLSEEELREIQNKKLQRLVMHCYDTVPYYTKLFDALRIRPEEIRTREDLKLLPVLTKQIIRDNYDDLFSTAVNPNRIRKSSSGGSTGMPLKFSTDWAEWSSWKASTLRAWSWYGLHLGDKIYSLGGNSINQKKGLFSYKGLYDRVIMRNYKYSSADVPEGSQGPSRRSDVRIPLSYSWVLPSFPTAVSSTGTRALCAPFRAPCVLSCAPGSSPIGTPAISKPICSVVSSPFRKIPMNLPSQMTAIRSDRVKISDNSVDTSRMLLPASRSPRIVLCT